MSRTPRADEAGGLYHALNRGNLRTEIFHEDADYEAFEQILAEALERFEVELYCYQLLPSHWHLVLRPDQDNEMTRFVRWVTSTHTMRYQSRYNTSGSGHVYQGRFKSFPIQADSHFLKVCRYVEGNARRAKLVRRAEKWHWSSLWHWLQPTSSTLLSPWPIARSPKWVEKVNEPLAKPELIALRNSVQRGCPFGEASWVESTVDRMGLESTVRPRGRPRVRFPDGKP